MFGEERGEKIVRIIGSSIPKWRAVFANFQQQFSQQMTNIENLFLTSGILKALFDIKWHFWYSYTTVFNI